MDITVAQAAAYHTIRKNDAWDDLGDATDQLAALWRASDYIRLNYRLEDSEAATALLVEATIRLAVEVDGLSALLDANRIKKEKEDIDGVIATEIEYRDEDGSFDPFPWLTVMLQPVTTNSGRSGIHVIRLVR